MSLMRLGEDLRDISVAWRGGSCKINWGWAFWRFSSCDISFSSFLFLLFFLNLGMSHVL